MRRWWIFLLLAATLMAVKVAVYPAGLKEGDVRSIENYLKDMGFEVVSHQKLLEVAQKLSKGRKVNQLHVIFAGKMLGLDRVYMLSLRDDALVVRLVRVKSGESYELFRGKGTPIEAFKRGMEKVMGSRKYDLEGVKVEIEHWRKKRVYKTGDIVRFNGKLYRAKRIHVSMDDNCPPSDFFWEEIPPKIVLGYFPSWGIYSKAFSPLSVDGSLLTHLVYAFANISDSGECVLGDPSADIGMGEDGSCSGLRGNFAELLKLKEKYPHLKILISVGGWTFSKNFSKAALTEESRKKLVRSCIRTFIEGDFGKCGKHPGIFDGIDVDWEYPTGGGLAPGRPEDRENFTLLMKEFRKQLDELGRKTGKHYILSMAGAADPEYIFRKIELAKVAKYVNFIVVMTYDFHGSWNRSTNFHNNLYRSPTDRSPEAPFMNVEAAIENYLRAGAPASKLLLGIPFYGRSWRGVPPENGGLYQPASGIGPGTIEGGFLDYSDIRNRYEERLTKHFHPFAQVPWLYGDGVFITYDDPLSVGLKCLYVLQKNLAGVAIWDLSSDIRGYPEGSLLRTINEIIR